MVTTKINNGWLELDDGSNVFKLWFEEAIIDIIRDPEIKHYEGGVNLSWDLAKKYVVVNVKAIWFDSHTNFAMTIDYLNDMQDAGTITVKIKRNSGGDYVKLDGNNTSIEALMKNGIRGGNKVAPYDDDTWKINNIVFEQGG